MTADELWKAYVKKYPAFADNNKKVTVSVETLEKMVKSAFFSGAESVEPRKSSEDAFRDVFGGMFGDSFKKK